MTICNMSIEAGARAGHDRAGRDHIRLPQGPRPRAARRASGTRRSAYWSSLLTDDDAAFDAEVDPRRRRAHPVRHLGHQPGSGAAAVACVPDPEAIIDENERAAAERALEYMGLTAGHAVARDPRRHGVPRLLHQRPDRGPARRRRRPRGRTVADGVRMLVVPGSMRVRGAGRGRGPGRDLHATRAPSGAAPAARCAWA